MNDSLKDTVPALPSSPGTDATRGAPTTSAPATAEGVLPAIDSRRYDVRSELARGGMGRVSIAHDTALGRTVAIKEMLSPYGEFVTRFRRELALTARLQHPGIVTIHDGGTWRGGEPVYVMRLVKGESFDQVIARASGLHERLALLPHAIAAVDALAYAHAERIIHRDLKPANILVGDFGETVVIDWGIAKDLDRPDVEAVELGPYRGEADAQTLAGAVLGTPAYMPPEQALGEPVDARADVYSLGAVLHHVLVGAPPHSGKTLADILASVIAGKSAALPSDLPVDLVAIVTKAMALDPKDRYASARELAADLKRFHAGQLVGAHRYSTWQLVRRWLHKHRTPVIVGGVAALALAVIGVVSVMRIVDEQRRSAEAERLALDSRRDAEKLLDFMLVELRDKLAPIGKVDLLATVAAQARDYYQRRPPSDDDDQRRRVLTRQNLSEVLALQGDVRAAIVEAEAAVALARGLVDRQPDHATWRHDLALAHGKVARLQRELGDLPTALQSDRAGLAIAESPPDLEAIAWLQIDIGDILRQQHDRNGALAAYRVALARAEALPADVAGHRRLRAMCYAGLGKTLRETKDLAGAMAAFRDEMTIVRQLLAGDPDNATYQRDLAIAHTNLGRTLKQQKDYTGALAEYGIALELDERHAARDPMDTRAQRDLAIAINVVSKVQLEQKDYASSLAGYRRSLAIREALAARDPSNAMWQRDLSVNHYMVGDVLEDSGDGGGALVEYKAALSIADMLAARDRTNASWQRSAKELRETVDTCCKPK